MYSKFKNHLQQQLDNIQSKGPYKEERIITTAQGAFIKVKDGEPVLNLCANNYLGLAQHPDIRSP